MVGALGGYGFAEIGRYVPDDNALAAGVGGRVSYTFAAPVRLSIGAEAVYHFGVSRPPATDLFGRPVSSATRGHRAVYVGGTLGWDAIAGPLTVRPYALAGVMVSTHECNGCFGVSPEQTDTRGALGAGVSFVLTASIVYFAADARVAAVFDGAVATTLYGGLGLRIQ